MEAWIAQENGLTLPGKLFVLLCPPVAKWFFIRA